MCIIIGIFFFNVRLISIFSSFDFYCSFSFHVGSGFLLLHGMWGENLPQVI